MRVSRRAACPSKGVSTLPTTTARLVELALDDKLPHGPTAQGQSPTAQGQGPTAQGQSPKSSPSIMALHHLAAPCFPSPAFAFLFPLGCSPTTFLQALPSVPLFLDEGPLLIFLLFPRTLLTGRGDTVPVCSKKTLNKSKMKG